MPDATLNGVTFTGSVFASDATRRAPQTITAEPEKVAAVLQADDGTKHIVYRAVTSREHFELKWQGAPEVTRAAVRAIFDLTTTFTAILPQGTFTVQCEPGDYTESLEFDMPGPLYYYEVTLKVHEA